MKYTVLLLLTGFHNNHHGVVHVAQAQADMSPYYFSGCDMTEYYNDIQISLTNRTQLHNLTKSLHRNVLPYTSSTKEDVWDALMSLDAGEQNCSVATRQMMTPSTSCSDTVHLIYADIDMVALPHGEPSNWNREHVWPKSLGVGYKGPDFTDVHSLRPADWSVNAARGNKYFGECGILHDMSECVIPAHPEAAEDTAADPSIWLPPAHVRGDLARALMYMAIRYDGEGSDNNGADELDLELSDCPADSAVPGWDSKQLMGYLSLLVKWHEKDPVDAVERERNDQICRRWQGNRNPFVDHPALVQTYFGSNSSDYPGYDCVSVSSSSKSPTSSPGVVSGTSCQGLKPGDVMLTGLRSDNPDVVTMVPLVDLPASTVIYMTDNAYTGTFLRSNEGTVSVC